MNGPVIITGTSSGLGLEMAVYLARRGLQIVATMRDTRRRGALDNAVAAYNLNIDILELDLTDRNSIQTAVDAVMSRYNGIAGLVNNAGIQARGFFEDIAGDEMRKVYDTNVFGTMDLTRAVLPHMRRARHGRIVLVTSVGGRLGHVAATPYVSTKFALEGFGESLACEVAPLGIRVSIVEPGAVKTALFSENRTIARGARSPESPYQAWFEESERLTDWAIEASRLRGSDVARVVYKVLTARRPRLRYLAAGHRAVILLALRRVLPFELFEKVYFGLLIKRITRSGTPRI